ncbi:MAG: hypothetical protein U0793_31875 [Gemmataceae bacterium]
MKPYLIATLVGGAAFVFMSYQLDWLGSPTNEDEPQAEAVEPKKEAPKPGKKLKFPDDLAPAARARAVPEAASFSPDAKIYPLVFMKANGRLFEKWQEKLNENWAAESVEQTMLVVVLGPHKKSFVDRTTYPNGAPPIERYRWELEVSVVEARTGKVLTNRNFVNMPRPIKKLESWELTAIGAPVDFRTVYSWVVSNARAGFPEVTSPHPVTNVVE